MYFEHIILKKNSRVNQTTYPNADSHIIDVFLIPSFNSNSYIPKKLSLKY